MDNSSDYAIPVDHGSILTNGASQPQLLNDSEIQLERESRARSGNYLETVATELENLVKTVDDELVSQQLEQLVEELLYVHERYEVVKKTEPTEPLIHP